MDVFSLYLTFASRRKFWPSPPFFKHTPLASIEQAHPGLSLLLLWLSCPSGVLPLNAGTQDWALDFTSLASWHPTDHLFHYQLQETLQTKTFKSIISYQAWAPESKVQLFREHFHSNEYDSIVTQGTVAQAPLGLGFFQARTLERFIFLLQGNLMTQGSGPWASHTAGQRL